MNKAGTVQNFRKPLSLLLFVVAAAGFLGAIAAFRHAPYYPSARIGTPGNIDITLLFNGRRDEASCRAMITNVTNSMLAVCPECQIKERLCLDALKPQHRKLLSTAVLDTPSVRLPDGGVMTYTSPHPELALAACQESERRASSRGGASGVVCYPANTPRPVPSIQKSPLNVYANLFGILLVFVGAISFAGGLYLTGLDRNWHSRLNALSRSAKRLIMVAVDLALLSAALVTTLAVRYGSGWMDTEGLGLIVALSLLVALPVFEALGVYRNVTRYIEIRMALTVVSSVTAAIIILASLLYVLGVNGLSAEDAVLYWLIALLYIGGSRVVAREYFRHPGSSIEAPERVIIYGAGDAGAQLAISLKGNSGLVPVAFVDDRPDLAGSLLYGIKVYRAVQLPVLVEELKARQILLAIPSASKRNRKEIFDRLEHLGVRIRTIPRLSALIEGRAKISDIEDISIEELFGRDPVPPVPGLLSRCIEGKAVLVTGAGGSIGSELCRQIVALGPRKLVLLELSEYALYTIIEELVALKSKFGFPVELVTALGSVTRKDFMRRLLAQHQVSTIYHAAAYKHVPLVEMNALEGIRNNVMGSLRAAEAAIEEKVETFVLISTDKAVRPTSVMGASKRLAELIVQAIGHRGNTRFCMVRFGNVLDSSGSVVPLFRRQIQEGGPVSVTHPEITRFFMTIPEAAQLVLQAGAMAKGGDVFVLDMGSPVKILDPARRMIHMSGLTIRDEKHPDGDIEITFTGLRPGEKLYEELLIGDNVTGTDHPLIMKAIEESVPWKTLNQLLHSLEDACDQFDQKKAISILSSLVPISAPSDAVRAPHTAHHGRSPTLKLVN